MNSEYLINYGIMYVRITLVSCCRRKLCRRAGSTKAIIPNYSVTNSAGKILHAPPCLMEAKYSFMAVSQGRQ